MSAAPATATQTSAANPAAPAPTAASATAVDSQDASADETADEGHRVYIGNLAFSATEEQIREHLVKVKVKGEIISVILPTRYKNRPAGYAFVTFKNEADAIKAVEILNETEIGGRQVHLQLARSKEENAERRTALLEQRKEAKAAKAAKAKEAKEEKEATEAADTAAVDSEKSATKADKPKKKKAAPKSRRRRPEDGDETPVDDEAETEAASKTIKPKKAREPKAKAENGEAAEKEPKDRKPRLALTGEASKNTVFVANLPFNIDDEGLGAIFTDHSFKIKSAHVIIGLRRLPERRPFRGSKGFGFVVLEDETQQVPAVDKINGLEVQDRKITVKVAQEMKPIEELEVTAAQSDADVKTDAKAEVQADAKPDVKVEATA